MTKDRTRKDTGTNEGNIRVSSDDQYEMTETSTPLYEACEKMAAARKKVLKSKEEFSDAEDAVLEEMKTARKTEINHKGDILVYVKGSTKEDHIRFKKA